VRRWYRSFLPIVVLAVLMQWLAPVGAFRVVAKMVSDPLAMSSLCAGMTTTADDQHATDDSFVSLGSCCAPCGIGASAPSPEGSPQAIFSVLQRNYKRVIWLEAQHRPPPVLHGSNTRARAPPRMS